MGAALGKLPELFGRNFAIGFLLPALVLLAAIWWILDVYDLLRSAWALHQIDTLADAVIVALVTWLTAIALSALNRLIVQTFEGYTFENWPGLRCLKYFWAWRYRNTARPALKHQQRIERAFIAGEQLPETEANHGQSLVDAVTRYPHDPDWILPTAFGNRYRAIETYSQAVYGLDAIPVWGRLQAVIPAEFQEIINDARAQLDFAVNLKFAGIIGLALFIGLAANFQWIASLWIPLALVAATVGGHILSFSALDQYGQIVKSAFDLYRGDLADRLGLELPRNPEAEQAMWNDINLMMIYHSRPAYERLTKYKKHRPT